MAKKQYTIGLDIGGTKILGVLYDGKNVLLDYTLATPQDNMDHFLIMLNAVVEPLFEKAREDKTEVKGVGVGVAGVLDYEHNKVALAPNIGILDGVDLQTLIEKRLQLPILTDNDTNCFTRAEALRGAGTKYNNIYGLIIGTGIGGAWWYGDEIYIGAQGGAGEPGAMIIDHTNGLSLEGAYHKLFQNNVQKISDEAYLGDRLGQKAFDEFGEILGTGISNIINVVDPELIVLGGGAINVTDLFLNKAKKIAKDGAASPLSKKIKIVKSKLGSQAGAIGAALLFR